MEVCQGTVIRVEDPINNSKYFDLDLPRYTEKMEITKDSNIEITFAKGYEKQGSTKWLYEIDVKNKSLKAIKPC